MKSIAGLIVAALSMVGLAHQNIVITPPPAAVTFPKAVHLSAATPLAVSASTAKSPKTAAAARRPIKVGVVLGTTTDAVVTQSQLQAAIEQASNSLRQLIYADAGTIGKGQYPTGGLTNNIALTSKIDQLSGTTLTNVVVNGVSGLTASDIPDLSSKYLTVVTAGNASNGLFSSNVGIGTTSPSGLLTLDSTSATGTILRISNGSTGGHMYDLLSTGSTNTGGAGRFDVFDKTVGVARLSIAANGNVGVGTTSPFATLSVNGGGYFSGNLILPNGASTSPALSVGDGGGLFRASANTLGVSNALHVDGYLTVAPSPFTPVVDAEIRDVNGDGYTEMRLADNPVVPNNFFAMYWHNQAAFIENWRSAGTAQLDISPKPQDGVSNAQITFFGNTITSGVPTFYINDGSGVSSAAHHNQALAGKGDSYLNAQAGMLGVGTSSPLATLYVEGVRGATSNEIARFADTGGGSAGLGLSLGYNSGGSTNSYVYNRYSGGSASAINFGFGTNFSTGNVLTLTQNGTAAFTGSIGIGTTTPQHNLTVDGSRVTNANNTMAGSQFALTSSGLDGLALRLKGNATGISGQTFAAQIIADSQLSNALEIYTGSSIPLVFGTAAAERMRISGSGNVGIGTSTPYSRLTVWGTDAASSTLSFNVVNNASTTVFAVFNGGNAQLSGTLTQSSDRRLKTNIAALDASTSLAAINSLSPVAYDWLDPEKGGVRQYGFIAQQVQQVFPNLVATTSPTALTPDGTLGLNYLGLIAPIVEAVQQLSADITLLASRVTSLEETVAGFANSFHTQQLCVGSTCINQQQLAGLLALEAQGQVQISAPAPLVIGATSTPPSINIQGSDPATINVGDAYTDLGAIAHDNQGHDLSYRTFINGALSGNILIDTSQVATDTIDYVATDTWGNTATSTRTVVIQSRL